MHSADSAMLGRSARSPLRASHETQGLRLWVQNDLGEVSRVNALATKLLELCGAAERIVHATQIALEEVLSNVIRHAYPSGEAHEIALVLRASGGTVELEVEDDGRAFDPTAAPEPALDAPLHERRIGGLGIPLLRAFVSEIRYARRDGRNCLWIRV
jgi:anti-sigma regulatory factor (Ser/Thr protein kinase)